MIIVGVATSALNYSTTPIFVKYFNNKKLKTFQNLANSLLSLLFVIFLVLAILQSFFSVQITSLIFPGFIGDDNRLIAEMFAIQAFVSIVSILIGVLNAINYTFNNLYRTIIIPIVGSVLQIGFVYFTYESLGIFSLVYALGLFQVFVFFGLSASFVKYYRFKIKIDENLQDAWKKMYPLILSSSFSKSDILIDRYFASSLIAGSISILHYGQLFISIITTFVNQGILLVSLRNFSSINDDKEKFNNYFLNLYQIMLIISMFFVIQVILSSDIVLIYLLEGDNFSAKKLEILYIMILSFLGVFLGGILSSVLVNAFYAKGLTSLVSKMSIILHAIGIGVKIIAFKLYGFYALAIVMSIKSILGSILLVWFYNINIYKINYREFLVFFLKVLIVSLFLLIISLYLKNIGINIIVLIILSSVSYMTIYYKFLKNKYQIMREI
jgi:putative peptidoglycan lipid II flippase